MGAALTTVVAGIYLVLATPQYTATVMLLIDTKSGAVLRASAPTPTDPNVESANIESQVELLKSEHILRKIVQSEHLIDYSAFSPGSIERLRDAVTGSTKEWMHSWLSFFGWEQARASLDSGQTATTQDRVTAAALALQKRTSARRIGLTYAVEVSTTMPDPVEAARIANAYARIFIEDQTARREEMARRISKLLEARTTELQAQAQEAERAVEQLKFSGSLQGESSANARVALRNLESSAQTYRVLHDKFLERSAETWQQQFLSLPDAQLASIAYPPRSKASPRTLVVLAAAIFIGLALGLLRAILRDSRLLGLRG
jgi:uncharacterized protein involved in exopolysaccharide biosynthesis